MQRPTFTADYKAIENILLNHYIEGVKQAKSAIMKPAFHPAATMYSVNAQGELAGGAVGESLFPAIDAHFKPSENPKVVIAYIDITGSATAARVDADDMNGGGFTDYFSLLKVQGQWVIVGKVFHPHY